MLRHFLIRASIVLGFILAIGSIQNSRAYSVLSHQAVIDAAWDKSIRPLLLLKYPESDSSALIEALSYSYGGAIMPDMGYYPMGSKFFTCLVHYVRTGDFVEALINESQNLNELAFALGALAHYNADNIGHPVAVNASVPIVYPKVGKKFGNPVTYGQNHLSHLRMEFGFDVLRVAMNGYTPEKFHGFIGFKISQQSLERAFYKVYGLKLGKLFINFPVAVALLRFSVREVIPELTKGAYLFKKKEIQQQYPNITLRKYRYRMPSSEYKKYWGKEFKHPGIGAHIVRMVIWLLPKYGPLGVLKFKAPSEASQQLYLRSFNETVKSYSSHLSALKTNDLHLENTDFDTGKPSKAGEYKLADKTYIKLLETYKNKSSEEIDSSLSERMVNYFDGYKPGFKNEKQKQKWEQDVAFLKKVKSDNK